MSLPKIIYNSEYKTYNTEGIDLKGQCPPEVMMVTIHGTDQDSMTSFVAKVEERISEIRLSSHDAKQVRWFTDTNNPSRILRVQPGVRIKATSWVLDASTQPMPEGSDFYARAYTEKFPMAMITRAAASTDKSDWAVPDPRFGLTDQELRQITYCVHKGSFPQIRGLLGMLADSGHPNDTWDTMWKEMKGASAPNEEPDTALPHPTRTEEAAGKETVYWLNWGREQSTLGYNGRGDFGRWGLPERETVLSDEETATASAARNIEWIAIAPVLQDCPDGTYTVGADITVWKKQPEGQQPEDDAVLDPIRNALEDWRGSQAVQNVLAEYHSCGNNEDKMLLRKYYLGELAETLKTAINRDVITSQFLSSMDVRSDESRLPFQVDGIPTFLTVKEQIDFAGRSEACAKAD